MITIVDYGLGNLGSVLNMFRRLKIAAKISRDIGEIAESEKILLPGVGAFDKAMQRINDSGLRDVLEQKAKKEKTPILGICLGMQLLTNGSDEGKEEGLGWINAYTHAFKGKISLKVPHMGWNEVFFTQNNELTNGLNDITFDKENPRFYFVHSFYVQVVDQKNSLLKTNYGLQFDSAIVDQNVFGCQFHPEKSHKFGMRVFKNFAEL